MKCLCFVYFLFWPPTHFHKIFLQNAYVCYLFDVCLWTMATWLSDDIIIDRCISSQLESVNECKICAKTKHMALFVFECDDVQCTYASLPVSLWLSIKSNQIKSNVVLTLNFPKKITFSIELSFCAEYFSWVKYYLTPRRGRYIVLYTKCLPCINKCIRMKKFEVRVYIKDTKQCIHFQFESWSQNSKKFDNT